uniref:Uncharacterized protein n=1 Tax=Anopheles coluzzii TaxID=1518534 RepID=A0A8W7Q2K9_ANOCL
MDRAPSGEHSFGSSFRLWIAFATSRQLSSPSLISPFWAWASWRCSCSFATRVLWEGFMPGIWRASRHRTTSSTAYTSDLPGNISPSSPPSPRKSSSWDGSSAGSSLPLCSPTGSPGSPPVVVVRATFLRRSTSFSRSRHSLAAAIVCFSIEMHRYCTCTLSRVSINRCSTLHSSTGSVLFCMSISRDQAESNTVQAITLSSFSFVRVLHSASMQMPKMRWNRSALGLPCDIAVAAVPPFVTDAVCPFALGTSFAFALSSSWARDSWPSSSPCRNPSAFSHRAAAYRIDGHEIRYAASQCLDRLSSSGCTSESKLSPRLSKSPNSSSNASRLNSFGWAADAPASCEGVPADELSAFSIWLAGAAPCPTIAIMYTWPQAFRMLSFSSVAMLSLYSWVLLVRLLSLLRSRATPDPIHALHTSHAAAVTWDGVSCEKAGRRAAPTCAWNCSSSRWPGNSGSGTCANLSMISCSVFRPSSRSWSESLVAAMNAIRIRSDRCSTRKSPRDLVICISFAASRSKWFALAFSHVAITLRTHSAANTRRAFRADRRIRRDGKHILAHAQPLGQIFRGQYLQHRGDGVVNVAHHLAVAFRVEHAEQHARQPVIRQRVPVLVAHQVGRVLAHLLRFARRQLAQAGDGRLAQHQIVAAQVLAQVRDERRQVDVARREQVQLLQAARRLRLHQRVRVRLHDGGRAQERRARRCNGVRVALQLRPDRRDQGAQHTPYALVHVHVRLRHGQQQLERERQRRLNVPAEHGTAGIGYQRHDHTCTTGELPSWASASSIDTLVFRCCDEPIPPTYRWRQPRASEWPVRVTTSRADFNRSKLVWASSAVTRESPTTWAMRPSASPAAQRSIGLALVSAPMIRFVALLRTSSCPIADFVSVKPLRPLSRAVKMFIWTASWRELFACLMHSPKCSSIWSRCLFATLGKISPNSMTDMSITATPSGSGPGHCSPAAMPRYRQQASCSRAPEPAALFGWSWKNTHTAKTGD